MHAQEAVREQPHAIWGKFAERERRLCALEAVRERPRADLGELTREGARSACPEAVCKRPHAIWGEFSEAGSQSACTGNGVGAAAHYDTENAKGAGVEREFAKSDMEVGARCGGRALGQREQKLRAPAEVQE